MGSLGTILLRLPFASPLPYTYHTAMVSLIFSVSLGCSEHSFVQRAVTAPAAVSRTGDVSVTVLCVIGKMAVT